MPTNYDYKRLIGWFKRVGATIVPFTTREMYGGGIELKWTTPTLEVDILTLGNTRRTDAAKVPLNLKTDALLRVLMSNNTTGCSAWVGDPVETDATPSLTAWPLANFRVNAVGDIDQKDIEVTTSAAGLVAARSNAADTIYRMATRGFRWARR